MGCRVEVIGFHNVSHELREAADSYLSGFLIPGLLPIQANGQNGEGQNGSGARWPTLIQDRGFGFFRYYQMQDQVSEGGNRLLPSVHNPPWKETIIF